jgi:uncharacterized protein YjiS (DUF1127 family)
MVGTQNVLDGLPKWHSAFALSSKSEILLSSAEGGLAATKDRLLAWHERARQRRALLQLSDDMLVDIGVSRREALKEAGKAFWRS